MDWQCVKGVCSSSQDYLFPKKSGGNTARVNRHTPFSTVFVLNFQKPDRKTKLFMDRSDCMSQQHNSKKLRHNTVKLIGIFFGEKKKIGFRSRI